MYIPDLTERFPEGFGGVDMTDKYYSPSSILYEPLIDDWDPAYCDGDYEEEVEK